MGSDLKQVIEHVIENDGHDGLYLRHAFEIAVAHYIKLGQFLNNLFQSDTEQKFQPVDNDADEVDDLKAKNARLKLDLERNKIHLEDLTRRVAKCVEYEKTFATQKGELDESRVALEQANRKSQGF